MAWSRACDEGSSTADRCTVDAEGSITAHYDDLSAPDVELTAPGAGPRRGTVTLSATASDDESDVTSVQFLVGGVSVGTDNNAPYQIDFDTTSRQASRSVGITIDNTVPSLTVDGPDHQTFGPGSTQRWTFAATDVTSGPPAVQCSVMPTGAAPSFGACSPGGGSHSVTNRPEGGYSARFRATDGSGNVRIVERTFSIDATPAVTRIDSGPPDGSSSADMSVTFTLSANESGSTFKCRVFPAALTPGAFGPCSGNGSHTASGFAPGAYTFEVLATDPFGNTDPTSTRAPPTRATARGWVRPPRRTPPALRSFRPPSGPDGNVMPLLPAERSPTLHQPGREERNAASIRNPSPHQPPLTFEPPRRRKRRPPRRAE
ncbi:MAG: large repetitive protein, partial [Solirubrobacteraceae bacterium]|nr:large repetitive protein [Solirubrobacteraceae bacterium]